MTLSFFIIKNILKIKWCIKKRFPLRLLFCDIDFKNIPRTTNFGHPYGITIREGVILGENCVFASNVTIGQRRNEADCAIIGDNVFFGTGSIILGPVNIPSNTIIPAGAIIKGIEDLHWKR